MKIAIVDDEVSYLEELEQLIKEYDSTFLIEKYSSGEEFFASNTNDFQIIFLDIEMGEINGIEVGKRLREEGITALIIYITNHTSYISDALRNQPFQYFLKPIQKESFNKDFDRAVQKVRKSLTKVAIKWKNDIISLSIGEILYIEYESRRLHFFVNNKEFLSLGRMSDMEEKLSTFGFLTTHKSFLVNMKYIQEIKKDDVILLNGKAIPMSKKYRQEVKEKFNIYLAGISI